MQPEYLGEPDCVCHIRRVGEASTTKQRIRFMGGE